MNNVKSFLRSKTVWGSVIAIAPQALSLAGINVTPGEVGEAAGHVNAIITSVGGLIALYGRVTAKSRLTL